MAKTAQPTSLPLPKGWILQVPVRTINVDWEENIDRRMPLEFNDEKVATIGDVIFLADNNKNPSVRAFAVARSCDPILDDDVWAEFTFRTKCFREGVPFSLLRLHRLFAKAPFRKQFSPRVVYSLQPAQTRYILRALQSANKTTFGSFEGIFGNSAARLKSPNEGKRSYRTHLQIERSGSLPGIKKLQVYRERGFLACQICDFDFDEFYDLSGLTFLVESHHLKPLATLKKSKATRLEDLGVVCPNCHAVIHRLDPMPSISELRKLVKKTR